jgi:hypothetical protein
MENNSDKNSANDHIHQVVKMVEKAHIALNYLERCVMLNKEGIKKTNLLRDFVELVNNSYKLPDVKQSLTTQAVAQNATSENTASAGKIKWFYGGKNKEFYGEHLGYSLKCKTDQEEFQVAVFADKDDLDYCLFAVRELEKPNTNALVLHHCMEILYGPVVGDDLFSFRIRVKKIAMEIIKLVGTDAGKEIS